MAKLKKKFISKLFNNKKNNSYEEQNNSDYFHNVVPPITNNLDNINGNTNRFNSNKNNDFEKVHDVSDVQVTSSFIIPLDEKLKHNSYLERNNDFTQHQQQREKANKMNTGALISFRNNFKIPKALSFEIRIEKLKQLMMSLFALIVAVISGLFISFYFSKLNIISLNYIPHPIITIPVLIFSLMILIINLIDFVSLKKEVNLYIEKTLKGSLMPPNFIIRNYRKIHGRLIIFNWLFIFCYVILGLTALIMYLISGQKITFLVQKWTIIVPNLLTEVVTLVIILGVLFFIHMMNFIFFKKRKGNIISYYGYEVVNPVDLEIYTKKINRICMIIAISFLIIIFFAIAIPILILRRRKKKN